MEKKADCLSCRYVEWNKMPSGRRDLNCGRCKYPMLWPLAYLEYSGKPPKGTFIGKWTKGTCQCWQKIPKETKPA